MKLKKDPSEHSKYGVKDEQKKIIWTEKVITNKCVLTQINGTIKISMNVNFGL